MSDIAVEDLEKARSKVIDAARGLSRRDVLGMRRCYHGVSRLSDSSEVRPLFRAALNRLDVAVQNLDAITTRGLQFLARARHG